MSDTIEPNFRRRLRYTPLRDLLRGRVTGRLDLDARFVNAKLPAPAEALCRSVVRRTRLWRRENIAVADELIAHFLDGLDAGATAEELITSFGDAHRAAKLIRRAKIRNRSLLWHALRWLRRGVIAVIVVYAIQVAIFLAGQPSPSVDYLAEENRPILQTPEADRAWPLYRQAMFSMCYWKPIPMPNETGSWEWPDIINADRDKEDWPAIKSWLAVHQDGLELLRQGAAKPALGCVLGPDGTMHDSQFYPQSVLHHDEEAAQVKSLGLLGVVLPELNEIWVIVHVLDLDARLAREQIDAARFERDVDAILGVADQFGKKTNLQFMQLYAFHQRRRALEQLTAALVEQPSLLSDQSLIKFAHHLAGPETAADFFDLTSERILTSDVIQRLYTDDGRGDGRLTVAGVRFLNRYSAWAEPKAETSGSFWKETKPANVLLAPSRRELSRERDDLLADVAAAFRQPLRDVAWGPMTARVIRINESIAAMIDPLAPSPEGGRRMFALIPTFERNQWSAEQYLGERDGVIAGMSLELFHRRTGKYPETLAELTPTLLPAVPTDRITGQPVQYLLKDGKPLVYSVGADRSDNGGVMALDAQGKPSPTFAASWYDSAHVAPAGDWILYPQRKPSSGTSEAP